MANDIYRAAVHLAKAHKAGMFVARDQLDKDSPFSVVVYSYEDPSDVLEALREIIKAIRPFLHDGNKWWSWHVFTRSGFYACLSDGSHIDVDGEPEDGLPVFASSM